MQCPLCKETIDDDSRYCDQCGEQIMVCSVCGRPGKGKRCIFDGKELVPAAGGASMPTIQPPVMQLVPQNNAVSGSDKIKLTSQTHGIMIEAGDGDIIGRKNGAFADIFKSFNYVSGTHCKIVKTAAGWHIQDMGSTNKTIYNGMELAPNALYPIASGTTVKIADVELTVTYDTAETGTSRL